MMAAKIKVGLAYNLKGSIGCSDGFPDDIDEEFDTEETISSIEDVFRRAGYDFVRLGAEKGFLERIKESSPNIVFNIAEGFGTRSREAHIPALLEFYGIPYTGSDPLVLSLTLEKALMKRVVLSLGIKTPSFVVVRDPQDNLDGFPLPAVVKPLYEGSSMGISLASRVESHSELKELVRKTILKYKEPVIVERFLSGREFTVGVLSDGDRLQVVGVMEICPRTLELSSFLYSLEIKRDWKRKVEYKVNPSWYEGMLKDKIEQMVMLIAETVGILDFARFDFRFDEEGEPNFLEVNPLPGLSPSYSDFIILAKGVGLCYDDVIIRILKSAMKRYGIESSGYI